MDFFGQYDGFDVDDDFDEDFDDDYFYDGDYNDGDDYWEENCFEYYDDENDDEYVDGYAATAVFPVIDSEEEAKKQADDWLDYAQFIFEKEEISNYELDDTSETFSEANETMDYFMYG